MLTLATLVEAEPPCEGTGLLRVEGAGAPKGMGAFARRMGMAKAPTGRSRPLRRKVKANALLFRRAARFSLPGFGEVLSLGRFARAGLSVQRRAIMAQAASEQRQATLPQAAAHAAKVPGHLAMAQSVGRALNRAKGRPVVAYDGASVVVAAAGPEAVVVVDWLQAALAAGTLRFSEGPNGFSFLAPGDPRGVAQG